MSFYGVQRYDPANEAAVTLAPTHTTELCAKIAHRMATKRKRGPRHDGAVDHEASLSNDLLNALLPSVGNPRTTTTTGKRSNLPTGASIQTAASGTFGPMSLLASHQIDSASSDAVASAPPTAAGPEGATLSEPIQQKDTRTPVASVGKRKRRKSSHWPDSISTSAIAPEATATDRSARSVSEDTICPGGLTIFAIPRGTPKKDPKLLARMSQGLGLLPNEAESESIVVKASTTFSLGTDLATAIDSRHGTTDFGKYSWPLSDRAISRLTDMGFEHLFAVQGTLLALLTPDCCGFSASKALHPSTAHRDICVTSPTGSGKTLSYVIPIVEALSLRTVPAARAIVLLPTIELCSQVEEVFAAFAKGTGLKAATHVFASTSNASTSDQQSPFSNVAQMFPSPPDILITTLGRLGEVLDHSAAMICSKLRYLVIDEADRMVGPVLSQVLDRIEQYSPNSKTSQLSPVREAMSPDLVRREVACQFQKVMFSATLTQQPGRLAPARLHRPLFVLVSNQEGRTPRATDSALLTPAFSAPAGLQEIYVVAPPELKPVLLLHLLVNRRMSKTLCFCKSIETAARLTEVLTFCTQKANLGLTSAGLSGDLTIRDRRRVLRQFKEGQLNLLVCSDVVARGIDLPDVTHVINYDAPVDIRKYIHRVGRTARAGRSGEAWTLLEEQEVAHFKNQMRPNAAIQRHRIRLTDVELLMPVYRDSLQEMSRLHQRAYVAN